jgi:hypothetical protein
LPDERRVRSAGGAFFRGGTAVQGYGTAAVIALQVQDNLFRKRLLGYGVISLAP